MTVELYFNEQIEFLYWGQHHFPEGCIITHEEYENTVKTAKKILCGKSVSPSLVDEFEYYVNLYQIYFEWHNNGRNGDFYEICKVRGLEYKATYTVYYKN